MKMIKGKEYLMRMRVEFVLFCNLSSVRFIITLLKYQLVYFEVVDSRLAETYSSFIRGELRLQ